MWRNRSHNLSQSLSPSHCVRLYIHTSIQRNDQTLYLLGSSGPRPWYGLATTVSAIKLSFQLLVPTYQPCGRGRPPCPAHGHAHLMTWFVLFTHVLLPSYVRIHVPSPAVIRPEHDGYKGRRIRWTEKITVSSRPAVYPHHNVKTEIRQDPGRGE